MLSRTGTLANTLGKVQPFRYRGYVYDEETGDYYLRSRYYRPGWGRFVSADALIGENLYSYCDKWNDGRILFFYIVVVSESTSSFDFWVCKLEDTGRSISAEFDSLIEKINPLLSNFR